MILFWIIAGVLTLAAAVVLAAPLFDTRKFKGEDAFALEVYRDQLAELTRDEQRGLLTAEQAKAAQIEIERRILALDEGKKFQPARPPSHHLTLAMAVILPLAGFGLYLMLGSPHLPSQSAMDRLAEERARTSPEVQALEAKVEQSPSDAQSWIDLGRAYVDVERAKDAKDLFAKAMALGRKEPDLLRQFAHAAILAEGGRVTTDAQAALQRALSADPSDPTSRFFLALAKAQNQDVEGALADWLTLERQLPPEAPLRQLLTQNIDQAARQLGKDPAKLPGRTVGRGAAPGPSADDMAAAEQMTPEQRQAFIESMVERLAAEMKEEPENLEGWIRLANAYGVLEKYGGSARRLGRGGETRALAPRRAAGLCRCADPGARRFGQEPAGGVPGGGEAHPHPRSGQSARPVLRRRGGARRRPGGRGEGAVGEGSGSHARRLAGAPAAAARDRNAGQAVGSLPPSRARQP